MIFLLMSFKEKCNAEKFHGEINKQVAMKSFTPIWHHLLQSFGVKYFIDACLLIFRGTFLYDI